MPTKINNIRSAVPQGAVVLSSWLAQNGLSRSEQCDYVHSGWLVRMAQGVYHFNNDVPTLYSSLAAYDGQARFKYHIGASSALELRGYSHFLAMGKPMAYVFVPRGKRFPQWILHREWDMRLEVSLSDIFGDIGLEMAEADGVSLCISSPERAIMECLHLSPEKCPLMDSYYLMEMLTTLRPRLVSGLLRACTSVKVKRLFLYMAEKAGHRWFSQLDLDGLDLGTGTRSLASGGVLASKYRIVVPKELYDYE